MSLNYNDIDPEQYDNRSEFSPRESYSREHWMPLIANYINNYCKDKIVLDLGCGTGTFIGLISDNTESALGIDISKNMLYYGKNKYRHIQFTLADVLHLPIKKESIDVIVSVGLLEYVDAESVFQEIKRSLKPRGICIIQCPNKYSAARYPIKIVMKHFKKQCQNEPSAGELLDLFDENNFMILEHKMDDGLIWLPNFLDKAIGKKIYRLIEAIFKTFGMNPFSNIMLFIVQKRDD